MSCKLSLKDLLVAVEGEALSVVKTSFFGVETDTRKNLKNKLFIALEGEKFDAHDFLNSNINPAIVITHLWTDDLLKLAEKCTVVLVEDTLRALQALASFWRKRLKTPILAITGSNGKTTSKEFAAQILKVQNKVHYSRGSFNNHWGVPFSLLDMDPSYDLAIIEMGMNHSDEIKKLCEISEPNVVVVTMVGHSHIGHFKSIQDVAKAKEEIYTSTKNSVKIFNLDNPFTFKMFQVYQGKSSCITFSQERKSADVYFEVLEFDVHSIKISGHIQGVKGEVRVPIFGAHNVVNLMVACCGALAFQMPPKDIWKALKNCRSTWGRNQLFMFKKNVYVLFDAYNANPESMKEALKNIYSLKSKGKKVAILGEMGELGVKSKEFHRDLAQQVVQSDFNQVWFVGPSHKDFGREMRGFGFKNSLLLSDTYNELLDIQVQSMLNPGDIVLVKGSRFIHLEKILDSWKKNLKEV